MTKTAKAKIEDIYPLSDLQQGLLMHHLYQENDQGRIRTECILKGPLQVAFFQQAWDMAVDRHQSLRSSVHWEKVEKPVQVVRPAAQIEWLEAPSENSLSLDQAPQGRWSLEKIDDQTHRFCWDSHHILLDGWSSGVILRDVFDLYDGLVKGEGSSLLAIPTYRNFLNWRKQQDDSTAEAYWSARLSQVEPLLLPELPITSHIEYLDKDFTLSPEELDHLKEFAKRSKVTLNSVIQGCWALVLGRLMNRSDVVFGTTVSGRPAEIPRLDQVAGLFTQVLPVRLLLEADDTAFESFLQEVQLKLQSDQANGHLGSERIMNMADSHGNKLFNSLLILQNYPWKNLSGGGVEVSEYQGDMTTTFPLTIGLVPGDDLLISFRYQSGIIPLELINWMGESMVSLLSSLSGAI
ncbi:MAG: condensation domain-containing protein, partial [Bacteroidota bacterium]